jgi:hypothetical protein
MFGWHVHEKASLHFTIPLALIAMDSLNDARHYFLLSIGMFCSWLQFHVYLVPLATFIEAMFLGAFPVHENKRGYFAILHTPLIRAIPILCCLISIMIDMS